MFKLIKFKLMSFNFSYFKEYCCINFEFKITYQYLQKILHK